MAARIAIIDGRAPGPHRTRSLWKAMLVMLPLALLGRSFHFPETIHDWLGLIVVLLVTAGALWRVAGWPSALLGLFAGLLAYTIDKHLFLPAAVALVALAALLTGVQNRIPGPRVLQEALFLGAGFLAYEKGRAIWVGDAADAQRNAERLFALEQRFHAAFESSLQRPLLDHPDLLRVLNAIYSWAYLPFILGTLFWLFLTDDRTYRLMRAALGVSIVLALFTIARYPVAPPRLLPASGLVDTHALFNRAHAFVNPFAAVPSFHVGWTLLAGVALFRSLRGPARWWFGMAPPALMAFTVIATGNHYWLDGIVGAAYVLVPFAVLDNLAGIRAWFGRAAAALRGDAWAGASLGSLTVLLLYLVIRQIVDPGFTNYWGYIVAQIAASIVIAVALQTHFAAVGGLSGFTYAIVALSTWADTLGTAGHMYSTYNWYDKVIHVGGGVTITAVAADIFIGHQRLAGRPVNVTWTVAWAFLVSSALTVGWEIYEYLGDRLFDTGRHAGRVDTCYDLIADTAGALFVVAVLVHTHASAETRARVRTRGRLVHHALVTGIFLPLIVTPFLGSAAVLDRSYNPIGDTLSNLAAQGQPNAWVARLGFAALGAAIVLVAAGVAAAVPARVALTRVTLSLFGIAVFAAGIFRDHPTGAGRAHNAEGFVHNAAGILAVVALLAAIATITSVAAGHDTWRPLLLPGCLAAAAVLGSSAVFLLGPTTLEGLAEIGIYTAAMLWLAGVAVVALRAEAAIPYVALPGTVRSPAQATAGAASHPAGVR